jgi:predicted transcriptional regulator
MKYRSRTEIVGQILEAANGGSTKTKIMYNAFLSYAQLKEYLIVLVENNLLEFNQSEHLYETTNKGHKYLKAYRQMSDFVFKEREISELPRM